MLVSARNKGMGGGSWRFMGGDWPPKNSKDTFVGYYEKDTSVGYYANDTSVGYYAKDTSVGYYAKDVMDIMQRMCK